MGRIWDNWSRRQKVTFRLAVACVVAVATATVGGDELGYWILPNWLGLTCLAVVAVVAVGTQILAAVRLERMSDRVALDHELMYVTRPLLKQVAKATGYDITCIGLSVFKLGKDGKSLKRLCRWRWNDHPPESGIAWVKGKGTVGKCLDATKPEYFDARAAAAAFPSKERSSESFARLSPEMTRGFDYPEFCEVIDKYGELMAFRVRSSDDDAHVLGCVGIAIPVEACAPGQVKLEDSDLAEVVASAAIAVRRVIEKPPRGSDR